MSASFSSSSSSLWKVVLALALISCFTSVLASVPPATPFVHPGLDRYGLKVKSSFAERLLKYDVVAVTSPHFMVHPEASALSSSEKSTTRLSASDTKKSVWMTWGTKDIESLGPLPFDHPEESTVEFMLNEDTPRAVKLNLRMNREMFSPGYFEERQHWVDGKRVHALEPPRKLLKDIQLCHYLGKVEGQNDPHAVAIDSCHGGFHGMFDLGETRYGIKPALNEFPANDLQHHFEKLSTMHDNLSAGQLHIVYKLTDVNEGNWSCGVDAAIHQGSPHIALAHSDGTHIHGHSATQASHSAETPSSLSDVIADVKTAAASFTFSRPLLQAVPSSVTVELYLANDQKRQQTLKANTETDAVSVANIVIANYQATAFSTTITIILVAQSTFTTGDPWSLDTTCTECGTGEVGVDALLKSWNGYRSSVNAPQHDVGQLLSGQDFQSTVLGYAGVGVTCDKSNSGGINSSFGHDKNFVAGVVSHELGHNFGMLHDSSGNTCAPSGNVMNAIVGATAPTVFSECSKKYLTDEFTSNPTSYSCFLNTPTTKWGNPVCGNNFIETGEQCDCGSSTCGPTNDPCCDGATCKLKTNAKCSYRGEGGCCTNTCELRPSSYTCRAAANASGCDLEEKCDGSSGFCPPDFTAGAGTPCKDPAFPNESGACMAGACFTYSSQCKQVFANFGSYYACDSTTIKSFNNGNTCGTLWCTKNGRQCQQMSQSNQKVTVNDGIPCGSYQQCKLSTCQASSALADVTANVVNWKLGEWNECFSCEEMQKRTVTCTATATGLPAPEAVCYQPKPATEQLCQSELLGCVIVEVPDGYVKLFIYVVPQQMVMFGGLGALAVFFLCVLIFYRAMTYKSDDEEFEEEMELQKERRMKVDKGDDGVDMSDKQYQEHQRKLKMAQQGTQVHF